MNIYDERPKQSPKKESAPIQDDSPYIELNEILANQIEFDDSVLYLNDDIDDHTLFDLMIRVRRILKFRESKEYKGQLNDPINLMINSAGGDIHEMMGLIDYIGSLNVKVNTICRGKAFSAAAVILTCGTGTRMISRNSTLMFHQASSMISGKLTDVSNTVDFVRKVENDIYSILAGKSKHNTEWWKNQMRSDLYLTADRALELGVVDQII